MSHPKRIRNCYHIREDYQNAMRLIGAHARIRPSDQIELALQEFFKPYHPIIKGIVKDLEIE